MNLDECSRVKQIAQRLHFETGEELLTQVTDTANELRENLTALPSSQSPNPDSQGKFSNDEFGALLDVYEKPRKEETSGPLDGYTMAVKDLIAIRGLKLTAGSESLSFVPQFDAAVVERLLQAGASIKGKANLDAFAFGPTGEFSEHCDVRNPAAAARIPGGSSSGSAAAVAGELVDAALGTDTGGSVRIPAACCGVVGIKPTHGLVPNYGVIPLAPSTDTVGPLARDTDTAATVLEAIAGYDPRDPVSRDLDLPNLSHNFDTGNDLHIGIPSAFVDPSSEPVQDRIEAVGTVLENEADVTVETFDFSLGQVENAYPLVIATEFAWMVKQSFQGRGCGPIYPETWRAALSDVELNRHIAKRVLPAAILDQETDGRSYVAARQEVVSLAQRFEETFDEYDALLTPTIRIVPPKRGEITATEGNMADIYGNTEPISLVGLPATSVPVGTIEGIPIGAQFVSPWFRDKTGIRLAKIVEQAENQLPGIE